MIMCEECGVRPANIVITMIVNGEKQEKHLCPPCFARLRGKLPGIPEGAIPDILKRLAGGEAARPAPSSAIRFPRSEAYDDLVCAHCGTAYADAAQKGRLVCEYCPEAFVLPLTAMLKSENIRATAARHGMKGENREIGYDLRINNLRKMLDQAIASEEYEEAARLRDSIRRFENEHAEPEENGTGREAHFASGLGEQGAEIIPDQDIAVETCVTVTRNAKMCRFDLNDESGTAEVLLKAVQAVVNASEGENAYTLCRMSAIPQVYRESLIEKRVIPDSIPEECGETAVLIPENENGVSFLINGKDNIVIRARMKGLRTGEAVQLALNAEKCLADRIEFASTGYFGYSVSSPEDLGTGMHISVIMHLPALSKRQNFAQIEKGIAEKGFSLRRINGNDGRSDLYELRNILAVSMTERDMADTADEIMDSLCQQERILHEELRAADALKLEDSLLRAKGILSEARLLPAGECSVLLSNLRFAHTLDMYDEMSLTDIDQLMDEVQPACVKLRAAADGFADPKPRDLDRLRADHMRMIMRNTENDLFDK